VNTDAWDEVLAQYYRVLEINPEAPENVLLHPEIEASAMRLAHYLNELNETLPMQIEPNPMLLRILES
jgi:uncharacterized protein (UPF0128 family)